uniref:IGFBP N-terminal domain-containing protein n=1 Tax=Astatotilapia calliptera TaxID=8154 RepID=A0A3P8NXZ9_ASTCA
MRMLLFLSALLGVFGLEKASPVDTQQLRALQCPPCERIHCSSRRALKLQCKGGVTTGVCGCCPVCAKTEGETCGGTWDYLGKCDEGLVCVFQDSAAAKPDAERKGICKRPSCSQTCAPSDSTCLQHFGKCVHNHLTAPHSPICHNNLQVRKNNNNKNQTFPCFFFFFLHCALNPTRSFFPLQSNCEGHFVCLIPDCPSSSS